MPWGNEAEARTGARFEIAHALRRSRVERKICNIYDLSPQAVGVFDVVFCGDLLLHLQNPVKALNNIRSVTREMAIISTMADRAVERASAEEPWLSFGHRASEEAHNMALGEACIYWRLSSKALCEMLEYVGFDETKVASPFAIPSGPECTAVTGIGPRLGFGWTEEDPGPAGTLSTRAAVAYRVVALMRSFPPSGLEGKRPKRSDGWRRVQVRTT